MNLKDILQNPTEIFDSPADVLTADELTQDEKIQILHRWEDDAKLLQIAEGEGMEGHSNHAAETLQEVLSALKHLGAHSKDR